MTQQTITMNHGQLMLTNETASVTHEARKINGSKNEQQLEPSDD